MTEPRIDIDNPFPPNAVTTFGVQIDRTAQFEYMAKAREYLVEYLKNYPNSGGGLALSGGHGSGKTFLVSWLSNEARGLRTRPSQTVYGKADGSDVTGLYRQFLGNIKRATLVNVIRAAVNNLGSNKVGIAQATKKTSHEIKMAGTLQPAFDEKVLDPNEVYLLLQKELEEVGVRSTVSQRVAYAIGVLEHPDFGEAAFNWLAGETQQLPKDMPIQGPLWPPDSIDAADIAVSALECVAALFRIAEIPLIFILDQMENFVPTGSGAATQASLLKKLIEQLSGQGALILMAGTPAAWGRLPRDVGPRLLNRAPLIIGGLNVEETALLLKSYYPKEPGFTTEAIVAIRDLSGGGNAREILRIANRAFAITDAAVSNATGDLLVQAAQESGSLADRATLALQMIDIAVERLKFSVSSATISDGLKIDRMVTSPQGARLAIVLLTSPDARAEAEDARKLTVLRKQLASQPNAPDLLVITVGYSSARVRNLVGEISRVLEFDETKFQDLAEQELQRLSAVVSREEGKDIPSLSPLLDHLTRLDERLARIEENRAEAEREIGERLSHGTGELSESARLETEVKTRFELREGLDKLHEFLAAGEFGRERNVLKLLLVANEANVKDATFDYLGSVYLDALDSAQRLYLRIGYGPISSLNDRVSSLLDEYSSLRSDLIRTMRAQLSSWQRSSYSLLRPELLSVAVGIVGVIAGWAVLVVLANKGGLFISDILGLTIALGCGVLSGVGFLILLDIYRRPQHQYRRFTRVLDYLRLRERRQEQ